MRDDLRELAGRLPPDHLRMGRELFRAMTEADRVLVTSEVFPDGDAFGAELAAAALCEHAHLVAGRTAGHVDVANEGGCPPRYAFMPGATRIRRQRDLEHRGHPAPYDLAITVDGGVERCGHLGALVLAARRRAIVDHHRVGSNASYDVRFVDPASPSTTQLLVACFVDEELGAPLTPEIASALYLGLAFDTGSFQYAQTSPLTHEVAAALMRSGADFARIHELGLLSRPYPSVVAASKILARAELLADGLLACVFATHEELKPCGHELGGIIQPLCFLDGIEVALLIAEQQVGIYKVSLRSRHRVDVAELARSLDAHGGGHARAAGCTLHGDGAEIYERVKKACTAALTAHRA